MVLRDAGLLSEGCSEPVQLYTDDKKIVLAIGFIQGQSDGCEIRFHSKFAADADHAAQWYQDEGFIRLEESFSFIYAKYNYFGKSLFKVSWKAIGSAVDTSLVITAIIDQG